MRTRSLDSPARRGSSVDLAAVARDARAAHSSPAQPGRTAGVETPQRRAGKRVTAVASPTELMTPDSMRREMKLLRSQAALFQAENVPLQRSASPRQSPARGRPDANTPLAAWAPRTVQLAGGAAGSSSDLGSSVDGRAARAAHTANRASDAGFALWPVGGDSDVHPPVGDGDAHC